MILLRRGGVRMATHSFLRPHGGNIGVWAMSRVWNSRLQKGHMIGKKRGGL